MRAGVFLLAWGLCAQAPDPAYEPLARAYDALRAERYDSAISLFLKAIEAAPGRVPIRKDLAYAYLKIGENEPRASSSRKPCGWTQRTLTSRSNTPSSATRGRRRLRRGGFSTG